MTWALEFEVPERVAELKVPERVAELEVPERKELDLY